MSTVRRTLILLAISVVTASVVFTVVASETLILIAGTDGQLDYPTWVWWTTSMDDNAIAPWVIVSGGVGALVAIFTFFPFVWYSRRRFARKRPPTTTSGHVPDTPSPAVSDNFGHASWASLADVLHEYSSPDPVYGGIVVGEAYDPRIDEGPFRPHDRRSWGHGGRSPLLIDNCRLGPTHSLILAGSGSFKTVSATSTVLSWTGSAVVLDPAGELGPMLEEDRRRMGHDVFVLSPQTAATCGFNALGYIDINSPMADTDVDDVVERICGYTPGRDETAKFFKERGKAMVKCLLTQILWDPALPRQAKTLRTLRMFISKPENELRDVLKAIALDLNPPSLRAKELAATLYDLVKETWDGMYANATGDTEWLSTAAYADLVSGLSFEPAAIANGKTTVFVSLPLKTLEATPAIGRCIIGSLLNATYEADGAVVGRILFLLDEAARLGPMRALKIAFNAGRKYGITLQFIYQSIGQIEQQWGREGKHDLYEGVSFRSYAAINDIETADELAKTIGQYGVRLISEGTNTGLSVPQFSLFGSRQRGQHYNYTEMGRFLIRPEELLHDLRTDAQVIVPQSRKPILAGRALYFRRPDFARRVEVNRFAGVA